MTALFYTSIGCVIRCNNFKCVNIVFFIRILSGSYDSYLGFIFQIKDFLTAVFRNKVYFALIDHTNQANTRRVEVVSDKLNEKQIPIM